MYFEQRREKIYLTCAKVIFANSSDLQTIPGKLKICSLHIKITAEQLFVCCLKKKKPTVASKYVQVNPDSRTAKVIKVTDVSLDIHIVHNIA